MLPMALLLCTSLIGQGQLEENCFLLGELLLCPEISSPLYAEFTGAMFCSSVLLLHHQHCWWLTESTSQSLCRGQQAWGQSHCLHRQVQSLGVAPRSVSQDFGSCCLMQLLAVCTSLCSSCVPGCCSTAGSRIPGAEVSTERGGLN